MELIARDHIPEAAVAIDPYARHTTTNLRNAARLLFQMGAPLEKPMLITASEDGRQTGAQATSDTSRSIASTASHHSIFEPVPTCFPFTLILKIRWTPKPSVLFG